MNYIVPEYYKNFSCKCGACRHSCCDGWPIRISMKEYYRLLGEDCSQKLRTRLDCALKLSASPNLDTYAQIATDWQGICMLHQPDGLCALQTELGEAYLPEVCRLYPRHAKRRDFGGECSCSNSCEAVIDILMQLHNPMRFESIELSMDPVFETSHISNGKDNITEAIAIIQDRSLPLTQRFILLSNFLLGDEFFIRSLESPSLLLHIFPSLLNYYKDSNSISDYCITSLDYFSLNDSQYLSSEMQDAIMERHQTASASLYLLLPNWQVLFEQLIVNHIFYNHFFFKDNNEKIQYDFLSLLLMYSFLKCNLLGNLSVISTPNKLVDYLASMFRVIEHSNFGSVAVSIYHSIITYDSNISAS